MISNKHNFRVLIVCSECGEAKKVNADIVITINVSEGLIEVTGCHGMSEKDLEEMIVKNIPESFKRRLNRGNGE